MRLPRVQTPTLATVLCRLATLVALRLWDYVNGRNGTMCMGLRVWDDANGEYVNVSAMRKTNARGRHDPTASRPPSVHERPRFTHYDRESHSVYLGKGNA